MQPHERGLLAKFGEFLRLLGRFRWLSPAFGFDTIDAHSRGDLS
jgi:hypothetical protein